MNEAVRLFHRCGEDAIRPGDRRVPLFPATRDARSNPADILQQSEAKHDWESPQLAQVEGVDGLVRGQELRGVVPVYPAILMSDQVEGQFVDPGEASGRAVDQSRQLPAVTPWQVPAGQGDLLLDEVVIVEQPGFRRHDPPARGRRRSDRPIGLEQDPLVAIQGGEQPVSSGAPVNAVRARQGDGAVFQLVAAQKF